MRVNTEKQLEKHIGKTLHKITHTDTLIDYHNYTPQNVARTYINDAHDFVDDAHDL